MSDEKVVKFLNPFSLRLLPDLRDDLERLAKKEGMSLGGYILQVLKKHVENKKK